MKRQPREIWAETRLRILARDGYQCVRCHKPLAERTAHIDHIRSGRLGNNADSNLRVLCEICHGTRLDPRHRGLTMKLLQQGKIGPNWRELLWEG